MADTPSSPAEPRPNATSSNSADPFNEPHVNYVRVGNCSGPGCVVTSTHAPPSSIPPCPRCEGAGTIPCPGPESPDPRDAEIARLQTHVDTLNAGIELLAANRDAECARLRAEVERWQGAFRSFGQHDYTCPKLRGGSRGCACGYSDIIRKLDAAATPPAGDARG